jgi:CubicO group peptidase (beta-lactamase class C family)
MGTRLLNLERFVFKRMADSRLPGLSLAGVINGELAYSRGFGFRDLTSGASATPDTVYGIGSVTKSFTALAVMQLQERGKLTVEDPVDDYIETGLRPKGELIRIKHLLNHSSGIPALDYAEAAFSHVTHASNSWMPISNTKDLVTFMATSDEWAHAKPGERWFYLNEGYILLGTIIEAASGMRYQDYVDRNVLQPLDMNRSYWTKEKAEADPEFATPYNVTKEDWEPSTYAYGDMLSDGGLISNATDMTHYVQMYLNDGAYSGKRIVEPESIKQMLTDTVRIPDEPLYGDEVGQYGYGLNVWPGFLGRTLIHHSGSAYVATSYIGIIPEEMTGVVVLTNGSGYPPNFFGNYALSAFLDEDPMKVTAIRTEALLEELEGTYATYMDTMKLSVYRRGGVLNIEAKDKTKTRSTPIFPEKIDGDHRIFNMILQDRKLPVEFVRDGGETWMIYERYKLRRVAGR